MSNKPSIRTITAFINLTSKDFEHVTWQNLFGSDVGAKISNAVSVLRAIESELADAGYKVQTIRIATNPFGEWLFDEEATNTTPKSKKRKQEKISRLSRLDQLLELHKVEFCSVGPAKNRQEIALCPDIVGLSGRFSCSTIVNAGDVEGAMLAAETILAIANLGEKKPNAMKHVQGGLGNFRFCVTSSCKEYIPFFPAAKSESGVSEDMRFAVGLENGSVAFEILRNCKTIANIQSEFSQSMTKVLQPIHEICENTAKEHKATFLGIDVSLNPSLDKEGSVAAAIEELEEVTVFGGPGTLAAAAEITKVLQNIPEIKLTGYCGLMLPICEDARLAELANAKCGRELRITDILSISSVCGVGVDTVPLPGDCTKSELSSLILDVAGIAGRWNKSLSCRIFPVPGKSSGDLTEFDSPYMVNAQVFSLN